MSTVVSLVSSSKWPDFVALLGNRVMYVDKIHRDYTETGVNPQCRQRTAILLLQQWQGCQVCVKISAQLPAKAIPI